jgi:hypothetical protein
LKDSFHRFNFEIYKEKEMADFRKWFPVLAIVALMLGSAVDASAQAAPLVCTTNAGVTPTVRAEGLTELVGDVIITCTGGTSTPGGVIIPQVNIQIFLNTNVTSRLVSDPLTEALLMIDDPAPGAQFPCIPATGSQSCPNFQGTANGAGAPNPITGPIAGSNNKNVYQGRLAAANSIVWLGIPVDPPGTISTQRTYRITNVRANANQLGVSSTLIPQQIQMFISATPPTSLPIGNSTQVVAFVQVGLIDLAVRSASDGGTLKTFLQCIDANEDLSSDPTDPYNSSSNAQNQRTGLLRYREGFASSFKRRNIAVGASADVSPAPLPQDVPGGIVPTGTPGVGTGVYNAAGQFGPFFAETGFYNPALPTPYTNAGLADHGTRLMARFSNVPAGVALYVGIYDVDVDLTGDPIRTNATARVRLVSTDSNGGGAFSATNGTSTAEGGTFAGLAPVTLSGGAGTAVWEVMVADPVAVETVHVPFAIAYNANTASNLPGLGTANVNLSFAPLSTVTTASASAPIPRFADTSTSRTLFVVNACTTNLLFPYVTQREGFDTGLVIANTSVETGKTWDSNTSPQSGACKICYYGDTTGGGAAPASQTSAVLEAGKLLIFTLFAGGVTDTTIKPTPGFQGYIIAQCAFQYAHGFAFLSDLGANRLAHGYLALILDDPLASRTGFTSETLGH